MYMNYLSSSLESLVELCVDHSSLFSIVFHDPSESADLINGDFKKILEFAYICKILFNRDVTKHAPEATFLGKAVEIDHPLVYFVNATVAHTDFKMDTRDYFDKEINL